VLENLVSARFGAAAVDVGCSGGLLESRGIFADVDPPDVVQGASAEAVNTFAVVGTDDDVGENGSGLKNENRV